MSMKDVIPLSVRPGRGWYGSYLIVQTYLELPTVITQTVSVRFGQTVESRLVSQTSFVCAHREAYFDRIKSSHKDPVLLEQHLKTVGYLARHTDLSYTFFTEEDREILREHVKSFFIQAYGTRGIF